MKERVVSIILSISMGFTLLPSAAFAQASSTSTAADLIKRIADLQAQIQLLQNQLKNLRGEVKDNKDELKNLNCDFKIRRHLRRGLSGEDVKELQEILSEEGFIPSDLITGFFGPNTEKAVRKFQEKHGIDMIGVVGPMTQSRIKVVIFERESRWDAENDDDDDKRGRKRRCHRTNPSDMTAPVISDITVVSAVSANTNIHWKTNELSTSKVWYSTSSPVSTSTASSKSAGNFVKNHSLTITGLQASTTYYYIVSSTDIAGNTSMSGQLSFMTSGSTTPLADTTAPVISAITSSDTTASTTKITWMTNEAAKGKLWYSQFSPVAIASTTASITNGAASTSQQFFLGGLSATTTYYYIAVATDNAGNTSTSSQHSFTTGN